MYGSRKNFSTSSVQFTQNKYTQFVHNVDNCSFYVNLLEIAPEI